MAFTHSESPRPISVVIPQNAAESNAANIGNESIVALLVPVGWVDGDISFKVGETAASLKTLQKSDGDPYVLTVGADEDVWIAVDPIYFLGHSFVSVVSSVNQTGGAASTRTILLKTRHV